MKKLLILVLTLLVLGSFAACNFTQNMSGAIASEAEATAKVEEMMAALADDNTTDAKALMHPQTVETADPALDQMRSYLAGRTVSVMELISLNISSSAGTAGTTRQERAGYQVTLNDGAVIHINVVYLSNSQGTGFAAFQLVLGVV